MFRSRLVEVKELMAKKRLLDVHCGWCLSGLLCVVFTMRQHTYIPQSDELTCRGEFTAMMLVRAPPKDVAILSAVILAASDTYGLPNESNSMNPKRR